jgi:hypothetical protein
MFSRILTAIRNLSTTSYASSSKSLGRWNSVVTKVDVIENKYIDWGNYDHCYCGPKCNNKAPQKKLNSKIN